VFSKVLYKDDEVVSLVVYRKLNEALIEIDFIATRTGYQRSGAASELLEVFQGVEVWLELSEKNFKALSFYKKEGFLITSERKGYYSNGDSALNMVRK
jgi:ribosomal protein S18 acetylase RimI-like enzyme